MRIPILAAFALLSAPLAAQTSPAATETAMPSAAEKAYETTPVVLRTAMGTITLEIETERAPVTAANFLRYVDEDRLGNAAFYRASKAAGGGKGFIQFGLRKHPDYVLPEIAHESTAETGLSHIDGAITMVRGAPGTADADYLIIIGDQPGWDAAPDRGEPGYAVFGRVTQGMETVKAIWNGAIDPDEGEGVLRGEMLAEEVDVVGAETVGDTTAD